MLPSPSARVVAYQVGIAFYLNRGCGPDDKEHAMSQWWDKAKMFKGLREHVS